MKQMMKRITAVLLSLVMILTIQMPIETKAAATCMQVSGKTSYSIYVGELLEVPMKDLFTDSSKHSATYTLTSPAEDDWIKIANNSSGGKSLFYTTSQAGTFNVTINAKCSSGSTATAKLTITVKQPSSGLSSQYNYNQTPASSVTVYVTISNDGIPIVGNDANKTVLSHLKVKVPYFSLENYDLQDFNRYQTDSDGNYVGDMTDPIERPTALHLYIYMLERYYFGLPESQCCKGNQNLDSNADFVVKNMDGKKAYNNDKSGLYITGSATSMYMSNFWGHDENLMYYRNHVYPLQRAGWGSTADYILLSNNDTMDVAMFTDWNFYTHGAFLCFGKSGSTSPVNDYTAKTGEKMTFSLLQFGTTSVSDGGTDNFLAFTDSAKVRIYKESEMNKSGGAYTSATKVSGGSGNNWSYTFSEPGTYYIVGMDANYGTSNACCAPATAKVVVSGSSTPTNTLRITSQPSSYTGNVNDTATFKVAAEGDGLTYQWYYKSATGSTFAKSTAASATTNTFSVTVTTARNGYSYYCKVSDRNGKSVNSNTVTLNVKASSLRITSQPTSYTGNVNDTATFKVGAEGDGLTYQWYYKSATGSTFAKSTAASATTNTYSVAVTTARNGYSYYCKVTDKTGYSVNSNTVTLTVKASSLTITSQPVDYTGAVNETAVFKIAAKGDGLTYQWYYKSATGTTFAKSTSSSATTATFSVNITNARDGYSYYCKVTDKTGYSVKSNTVKLTVKAAPITITSQPVDFSGSVNATATFKVAAQGNGLTYQWYYKSTSGTKFAKSTASSATTNTFTVTVTNARNGYQYYCKITDKDGNSVNSNTVTLKVK